jgi:hypothetical protein
MTRDLVEESFACTARSVNKEDLSILSTYRGKDFIEAMLLIIVEQ